jgi:hypothetical protein
MVGMSSRKASTPEWEQLLSEVGERHPEVASGAMFGMPCAKVAGKAFMGSFDGGVVFKLDEPLRGQALALGGSALFDPSGNRPMRAWVVVPAEHRDRWPQFAAAALSAASTA